jgi:hypothetical protein
MAFALATGAALLVPFAAPASAALTSHVACAKEGSTLKNGKATSTFATCTPAALKAGGIGVSPKTPPPGTKKGQLALTITWKGGMGTTTVAFGFTQTTQGKCKAPTKRYKVTGSVKAATGKAAKITLKGEPVSASACVYASGPKIGQSNVEPGTKFKL